MAQYIFFGTHDEQQLTLLTSCVGLQVEQQRDLSRAGFTDPEGIEFDHDEVNVLG